MTINEAIDQLDEMKPNMMSRRLKVAALAVLDGLVWNEIIRKHSGWQGFENYYEINEDVPPFRDGHVVFKRYTEDTDPGQELLAKWPYDEMYVYWLMAEVDRQTLETDKYNNDMASFNQKYEMFQDYWRRTHMPLTHNRELRI